VVSRDVTWTVPGIVWAVQGAAPFSARMVFILSSNDVSQPAESLKVLKRIPCPKDSSGLPPFTTIVDFTVCEIEAAGPEVDTCPSIVTV